MWVLMQEPPRGFLDIPVGWAEQCGNYVSRKIKNLATSIVQYTTSAIVISVLINSITMPTLERVVLPTCQLGLMAGTAGMAASYWVQSCTGIAYALSACVTLF